MEDDTTIIRKWKRRLWLGGIGTFLAFLAVDQFWGVQLGIRNPPDWDSGAPAATSSPADSDTFSPMPSLIDDPSQPDWMVEGFWYCWNNGPLLPHHLDHHVPGDHLCTWGELRSSGFAWQPPPS